MDDNNSKELSLEEFRKGCRDFRVDMDSGDIDKIFYALDRNRNGAISIDELVLGIRGPMAANRS